VGFLVGFIEGILDGLCVFTSVGAAVLLRYLVGVGARVLDPSSVVGDGACVQSCPDVGSMDTNPSMLGASVRSLSSEGAIVVNKSEGVGAIVFVLTSTVSKLLGDGACVVTANVEGEGAYVLSCISVGFWV